VLLTPRFGLPAVWWYAPVSTAEPDRGRAFPGDGARILEIGHRWFGVDGCRERSPLMALESALAGVPRVSVYLGFDSNSPAGFQQLVLDDLSRLGARVSYRAVASEGFVAIFDLRQPPNVHERLSTLPGCVGVRSAVRW
jgi:hypothetical protein